MTLTMSFLIIICAFKKGNNTNTTRYKCTHAVFASQPDARDGLHGGTDHSRKIYLLTRVIQNFPLLLSYPHEPPKKSPLTRNSVCHCFVEMHIYYQITVIILLCFRQNRLMFILGSGLSYRIDPVDIGQLILTLRKINEPAVCPSTCILLTIDK